MRRHLSSNKRKNANHWLNLVGGNADDDLILSIIKNLSHLLNSRQHALAVMKNTKSAHSYILSYGMPDLSQFNPASEHDQQLIQDIITNIITDFEPRLSTVSISTVKQQDSKPLALLFQINALIKTKVHSQSNIQILFESTKINHKILSWQVDEN